MTDHVVSNESQRLKQRVADACRVMGVLDITQGTVGHASARFPGADRFFIRARGPAENAVRYTTASDVIEVDLNGAMSGTADAGYAVPMEVHIHTQIYRHRPEVNAVVHMHPRKTVLLSICDKPLRPIYGAFDPLSLRFVLNGVPTFPSSLLITDPVAGAEFAVAMGDAPVCIMRGHGLTTAANSVEEAALAAIQIEELAAMQCEAEPLGGATDIPAGEQAVFREMQVNTGYGDFRLGEPSGRSANLWRYYLRLANEAQVEQP